MTPSFKLNLNRSKSPALVGLDIQPGYVAAVQARVNGEIVVERAASAALPAEAVHEGEVRNREALAASLRHMFDESDLDRRVRIGIANQRTVLRMLELPPISDTKELSAAVHFQAEDQVPMPLGNAVLDFHPLGIVTTSNGPRQRVALVAAQRDTVEKLLSAAREAGLRPEGVDLSAFAMIRSLYRADRQTDGRVLYLNVGGLTNMAIADGLTCHFTRVVGGGLEAMAMEIAERREISLEEARAALSSSDLRSEPVSPALHLVSAEQRNALNVMAGEELSRPTGSEEQAESEFNPFEQTEEPTQAAEEHHDPPTEPQQADDVSSDVQLVIENGSREIAGEVRNSLDFYRSQEGGAQVTSVILSGPALEIDGFAEKLQGELGLPVHCEAVHSLEQDAGSGISTHRLAIAAGLATEETHP